MFKNMPNDKYDFVLGHDILQELAFDLCYSAKAFVWHGMSADMVPRGFWTAGTIANFWNVKHQSKAIENSFKQNITTDANTYLTPSKETAATIGLLDVKEQITATTGLLNTHENKTATIGLLTINTPMAATTGLLH
jgi:hypothetical protein